MTSINGHEVRDEAYENELRYHAVWAKLTEFVNECRHTIAGRERDHVMVADSVFTDYVRDLALQTFGAECDAAAKMRITASRRELAALEIIRRSTRLADAAATQTEGLLRLASGTGAPPSALPPASTLAAAE